MIDPSFKIRYLPPWGVEFDEHKFVLSELLVKVLVGEYHDTVVHFNCGYALEREESEQYTQ